MARARARTRRLPLTLLAAMALAAVGPASAPAAVTLKNGASALTSQTHCFPERITAGYTQQDGQEPRVGETFYVVLTVDQFLVSTDCAADFIAGVTTLPAGVEPAVGGAVVPLCSRYGTNSTGQVVSDARAQSNCPTALDWDPAARTFSMRPRANPGIPDVGGPAGSYWMVGVRAPQESQEYSKIQMQVPVRATSQFGGGDISILTCAVGSECLTVTVPLAVRPSLTNGAAPEVTLPGEVVTTTVGAKVPFAVNGGAPDNQYRLMFDIATNAAYTTRPCGATAPALIKPTDADAYSGPTTSEAYYGDLATSGSPCYLNPNTDYWLKVCSTTPDSINGAIVTRSCRETTFRTGSIVTSIAPRARFTAGDTSERIPFQIALAQPAPVGQMRAYYRLKSAAPDGAWTLFSSDAGSTSSVNRTITGLLPYRTYQLRPCYFASGVETCNAPIDITSGATKPAQAPQDVTATSATLNLNVLTPKVTGSLVFRLGTVDPRGRGVSALPVVGTQNPMEVGTFFSQPVTGLIPDTTYYWTGCYTNNPAEPTLNACFDPLGFFNFGFEGQFKTAKPASHSVTAGTATDVTDSAATLPVTIVGPHAGGTLEARVGPVGGALTANGTEEMPAAAGDAAAGIRATGLPAGSDLAWQACFVSDGVPTACSETKQLRTAAAPGADPGAAAPGDQPPGDQPPGDQPPGDQPPGDQPPGGIEGPGVEGGDDVKPNGRLRVKGRVRPRRRITLIVRASDASGIRSVKIKVGKRKPVRGRRLRVRVPAKGRYLAVKVTITDRAGNVRIIKRRLRIRRP